MALTDEEMQKIWDSTPYNEVSTPDPYQEALAKLPKQPGMFQSIVQGVAKPILKTGLSVARVAKGVGALASGNKEKIAQTAQDIGKPKDFGYFGKVNVGGFDEAGQKLSTGKTVKSAIGTGLELGSLGVGGGGAGAVGKATVKGAILKGAAQGAKYGALGGGMSGTGQALDEGKGFVGTLASGATGALAGGVLGGVAGGVAGGIGKGVRQLSPKLRAADAENKALNRIVPKPSELTPTEYDDIVRAGRLIPKTKFNEATIVPSKEEIALAKQYKGLLNSNDPVRNADNVLKEIERNDQMVGQYLSSKKIIYNTGELRNSLLKEIKDVDDIMVPSTERLAKMKEDLVDSFVKGLRKNDLESLWRTRKGWDQLIESRLKAFGGSPTLKKDIARGIRNGAQKFITERLGDDVYAGHMGEMRNLFKMLEALNNKASAERGKSAIALWLKRNPNKRQMLWWLAGLTGIGAVTGGAKAIAGE